MNNAVQFVVSESVDFSNKKVIDVMPNKVIFDAIIQTADEPNRNKRIYTKQCLVNALQEKYDSLNGNLRGFIGELNHPNLVGYTNEEKIQRIADIPWERVSHIITKWWWNGNELWARIESTFFGMGPEIVKIIKDNVPLGFSLRALGKGIKRDSSGNMIIEKLDVVVAYDAVTMPSHSKALFQKLNEEQYFKLRESCEKCNDITTTVLNEQYKLSCSFGCKLNTLQEQVNYNMNNNDQDHVSKILDFIKKW